MLEFLGHIAEFLWGPWTMGALLVAGILFTLWSRLTQVTAMTHGIQVVRGVYDDPDDPGAINHFQALSAALSATVGLGNIGGVALAIGIGGPGALFWMWIVGFFGMALKTIEITLAMMYRNTDDPENPHGGAMWVVEKVIGGKGGIWQPIGRAIGVFFCVTLIISCFTGGNMSQSWSVANLTFDFFRWPKAFTGILLAVIVGLVIIGGIKRIGSVAGKLVPLMCVLYLLAAFGVLLANLTEIPSLLWLIVKSAFSPTEAAGAFVGGTVWYAFTLGMKRALFSNEAGQGSAPIAHAAAKTDEPAREGVVGGIGPFIDTICICTITALVILSTGTWNRPAMGDLAQPLVVTAGSDANEAWSVAGPEDVAALPADQFGSWEKGDEFFVVANVIGANHLDTADNKLALTGKIAARPRGDKPAEAPDELFLQWNAASVERFDGQVTAIEPTTGVYRKYDGANLTAHAFDRQFEGLGRYLVTLAAWLFAISTMISWSYYGEQGMVYMLGEKSVLPYKIVFLMGTIYAAAEIKKTDDMIILMDLGTGAMLWANLPIVLGLGYLAVNCLVDYNRRLKAGEFKKHK